MNPQRPDDLEGAWREIEKRGQVPGDDYRYYELDVTLPDGAIHLAVDTAGRRHLLIPVTRNAKVHQDTRSRGVGITREILEKRHEWMCFVDVACQLPHLHGLFSTVAAEMIEAVPGSANASAACRRILDRWRELLERVPTIRLSDEELIGLLGELLVLRDLLKRSPDAVNLWWGPVDRDRHDFRGNSKAIEVKSTRSRQGRRCQIHGHDQLEVPADGELYLSFLRFEPDNRGLSLPGIVGELRELTADRAELERRLALAGIPAGTEAEYREQSFTPVERRMYQVDGDFPRIVSETFAGGAPPANVTDIRYKIDLSSEPPIPLNDSETEALLAAIAGAY